MKLLLKVNLSEGEDELKRIVNMENLEGQNLEEPFTVEEQTALENIIKNSNFR